MFRKKTLNKPVAGGTMGTENKRGGENMEEKQYRKNGGQVEIPGAGTRLIKCDDPDAERPFPDSDDYDTDAAEEVQ